MAAILMIAETNTIPRCQDRPPDRPSCLAVNALMLCHSGDETKTLAGSTGPVVARPTLRTIVFREYYAAEILALLLESECLELLVKAHVASLRL
jgi:hypothetical protein